LIAELRIKQDGADEIFEQSGRFRFWACVADPAAQPPALRGEMRRNQDSDSQQQHRNKEKHTNGQQSSQPSPLTVGGQSPHSNADYQ